MGIQDRNKSGASIESTGTLEKFTPNGRALVEIQLSNGDNSIDVDVDVADDDETNWETVSSYTGVTSIDDDFETVASKVRVRITSAASGGDTADYYFAVGWD